jgi:2-oxo-3-hexenedioate decarboxylase
VANADRPCGTTAIAQEIFDLLETGRQIAPISTTCPGFGLAESYDVVSRIADLRHARGENVVGRKIGFTNRAVWQGFGISGPIWGYLFDTTVQDLQQAGPTFSLKGLPEPRIEPEMVLHLSRAPELGMDERQLAKCVDWIAHGFEIVFSIFPGWNFTAADAVEAFGVHGALLLGNRRAVAEDHADLMGALANFTVELSNDSGATVRGHGRNVLGGPLTALRFLVEELARLPNCEPLRAGEIVTTGTLTEAMPAIAGDSWTTSLTGIEMQGICVTLTT